MDNRSLVANLAWLQIGTAAHGPDILACAADSQVRNMPANICRISWQHHTMSGCRGAPMHMLAAQLMTVPDCGPEPSGMPALLVKLVIVLTVVPLVAVVRVRVGVSRTVAGALAATEGVTDISLPCALLAALHAGKSWQRPWCECYKYDSQPAALQSRGCMVQCGEGGQAAHAYSCCRGLSSYCCSNQHHPHKHGFARHRSLLHQGSPLLLNTAATATIRFLEP